MVTGQCTQDGCSAGSGGECIENVPLERCPNFVIGPPAPDEPPAVSTGPENVAVEPLPVRGGGSLSPMEVDAYLRVVAGRLRTVAIVGDPEAGKTTLISSIYELLRRRRMSFGFAGSRTLRGLEQRCHLSRTASGRRKAATRRTRLLEALSFLHLEIVDTAKTRWDLVLCDRAGETYEELYKRPAAASEFGELAGFDVICLLLDGERLRDPGVRQAHISNVRRLCLAMEKAGHLINGRRLQLILTKIDELDDDSSHSGLAKELFASFVEETRSRFPGANHETFTIAARPPSSGDMPFGANLEDLMRSWLRLPDPVAFKSPITHQPSENAFDNLTMRFREHAS
ncbi:hypothetical protein D3C72_345100 [compost metagenome]